MIIERLYDVQVCRAVCEKIWDEISEDDAPKFYPDVVHECWLGIYEEDADNNEKLSGIYRIHELNGVTWQIHALMIDRENAKESGRLALQWCYDFGVQKLIAEIPVIYPNVYHFTKHQGFQDEGINRKSFKKNGEIVDCYRLGITREEIWQQLSQQ